MSSKRILFFLILLISIFFSACNKIKKEINFWNFKFELETKLEYEKLNQNTEINSDYNIDRAYIEKQDKEYSWYKNSILIRKIEIPIWTDLQKFKEANIQHTQSSLNNFSEEKEISFKSNCKEAEVNVLWDFFSYITKTDIPLYFGQIFFIINSNWYIVSFSSENKKETKTFISDIKKIYCE